MDQYDPKYAHHELCKWKIQQKINNKKNQPLIHKNQN